MKKFLIVLSAVLLLSAFLSGCSYREPVAFEPEEPAESLAAEPESVSVESAPVVLAAAVYESAPAAAEEIAAAAEPVAAPLAAEPVREPAVPREPAPAPDSPYLASYASVLDSISAGTAVGEWDPSAAEGVVYGYTLDDLDVNGIPELIIGNLADETDDRVYAVFTLSNGQPVPAAFGTDTDSWFLSKAGGLYLRREAGEMNADYIIYSFGGTKLEAFFGCFESDGTDGSAPGYYRVAYGDRHSGTAFDVTREEFESDIESFEATIIPLSSLTTI